jgi:spermidine/putrescine transport system permease protein
MKIKYVLPKIVILWLFIFSFLPGLMLFTLGFMTPDIRYIAKLPLTITNYSDLLSPAFLKIIWRSFYIAGFSTLVCFILAYPFSYFVLHHRQKTVVLVLILIPFWTSSLIRTFAMVDLIKMHGLMNSLLLKLNIIALPLNFLYTNSAVLLGLVYNLLPFMILPIFNAMETIDTKCIEAAKDLGATSWQIFQKIFWPQTKKGVTNGMTMVFLPAMTLFYIPNILGGAKSMMIGNLIQNQFLILNDWPKGAAISTLLSFILIMLFYFSQRKDRAQS